MSFISSTTIVPLFISKLTDNPLPIGLAALVAQAGWHLPQLFVANWVERLPRRMPIVMWGELLLVRIPVCGLAAAALIANRTSSLALLLFLLFFAWRNLGSGIVAPAWHDLIARIIPVDRRGRFWRFTTFVGSGVGLVGSALTVWLLRANPFPVNFAMTFALAAAAHIIGWLFISQVRETAVPIRTPRQNQRQFLNGLRRLLRLDPLFRRFLVARLLLSLSMMGMGFVTVAAVRRWGVTDGTVATFTGAQYVLRQSGLHPRCACCASRSPLKTTPTGRISGDHVGAPHFSARSFYTSKP